MYEPWTSHFALDYILHHIWNSVVSNQRRHVTCERVNLYSAGKQVGSWIPLAALLFASVSQTSYTYCDLHPLWYLKVTDLFVVALWCFRRVLPTVSLYHSHAPNNESKLVILGVTAGFSKSNPLLQKMHLCTSKISILAFLLVGSKFGSMIEAAILGNKITPWKVYQVIGLAILWDNIPSFIHTTKIYVVLTKCHLQSHKHNFYTSWYVIILWHTIFNIVIWLYVLIVLNSEWLDVYVQRIKQKIHINL